MNLVLRNHFSRPIKVRHTSLDEPFERLMNSMFQDFLVPTQRRESTASSPLIDVTETEKTFSVKAELPGVRKEDIKIAVDKKRISIEAEIKHEAEKKDGENVVYAERSTRKFSRSFALPVEVDDERVEAKLENGILTLTLPKKEAIQPKKITVQ